jgi:hypothetical protein
MMDWQHLQRIDWAALLRDHWPLLLIAYAALAMKPAWYFSRRFTSKLDYVLAYGKHDFPEPIRPITPIAVLPMIVCVTGLRIMGKLGGVVLWELPRWLVTKHG